MARFLDEQVDTIISNVLHGKTIHPKDYAMTDHQGQNALLRYIRQTTRMTPPQKLCERVIMFIQYGFNPYQPNDDGICALTALFFRLSRHGSPHDEIFFTCIQSIVLLFPPIVHKLSKDVMHPLQLVFSMIQHFPTANEQLMVLRRRLVIFLLTRLRWKLDMNNLVDLLLDGINKQLYDFTDPILSTRFATFSHHIKTKIVNALLEERMQHEPHEMDDLDNKMLARVLRTYSHPHIRMVYKIALHGDVSAFSLLLPLVHTRNSLFATYLRQTSCRASLPILHVFFDKHTRLEDTHVLHQLIESECLVIVRILYMNHAITKRQLLQCLETFHENDMRKRKLMKLIERSQILSRFAQASLTDVQRHRRLHQHSTKNKIVKQVMNMNNPDTLKELAEFL
jgi:hypothetical protein